MIAYLLNEPDRVGEVSVLVGARKPCDLLYSHQYSTWTKLGFRVQTTVDRDVDKWNGHVGVVTLLLERLPITRPESTLLMTCGPEIMMRYVAGAALDRGVPSENIWVALERNMNCAIGHCGHCQLGPEFVCKDGPVFPYDRVAQWLHVQGL
jgi:NAD(P)H-flavin reductase